jgi:hypothetical protein
VLVFLASLALALPCGSPAVERGRQEKGEGARRKAAGKEGQGPRKAGEDGRKKAGPRGRKDGGERKAAAAQRAAAFSDEAVRKAIENGQRFLWSQQRPDGGWPGIEGKYPVGPASLAAYALLASGVSPLDKRMEKALNWLSRQPCTKTYSLALRCNVWLLANRETGDKYSRFFRSDVIQLIKSTKDGSYNYDSLGNGRSSGDNSNSQFGVLGVWAGVVGLAEVPEQYWMMVLNHWRMCQNRDGGWPYRKGQTKGGDTKEGSRATMTAAGLATLFVCFDNLYAEKFVRCDVNSDFVPIRKGMEWMDRHYVPALRSGKQSYYFIYGVERVGLASGYKYFGTVDWYKLGAQKLLGEQGPKGAWGGGGHGPLVNTSFALLFLARGQHPVAFNKLEFDGDWNNRPRDLAGLTRWMSGSFEKMMSWQIISLKAPVSEWHDAPILYLSASQAPKFTDPQIHKLRTFIWQGGTIFSVTECNGQGFRTGIRALYEELLPGYSLKQVPKDHALYDVHNQLRGRPVFFEIHNGIRPLVIHTDSDLPRSWQLQMRQTALAEFQAAANVLMYVTDKGLMRNRGVSPWPAAVPKSGGRSIRLARLRYEGNWDPEPLAYERFRRLLAAREKIHLEVVGPVSPAQLDVSEAKVAAMTGTESFTLSDAQQAGLRRYLDAGGTLILDAAGGSRAFGESVELLLQGMFGRRAIRRLGTTAELYELPGRKIQHVSYRRKAHVDRGLSGIPNLRGVMSNGRIAVIFSAEDLTGGLVGCPSYGCVGYQPESCYELMRNAILYAADGAPKPANAPVAARPQAN